MGSFLTPCTELEIHRALPHMSYQCHTECAHVMAMIVKLEPPTYTTYREPSQKLSHAGALRGLRLPTYLAITTQRPAKGTVDGWAEMGMPVSLS